MIFVHIIFVHIKVVQNAGFDVVDAAPGKLWKTDG